MKGRLAFVALTMLCATAAEASSLKLTGIAFVDSDVTGQGSKARLPEGAKIYPIGSRITGKDGCPTTPYRTDGLIVAIIDYAGPPTAASLEITRGSFARAPYQLNLDPGRTLQFLGPVFDNGTYTLKLTYGLGQAKNEDVSGSFELARSCPGLR